LNLLEKEFPVISPEQKGVLKAVVTAMEAATPMLQASVSRPPLNVAKVYAQIRGNYMATSLQNLAAGVLTSIRKANTETIYRKGDSNIVEYGQGIEGMFRAEYDNIGSLFSFSTVDIVWQETCQLALESLSKTLREVNTYVRAHITTDCFLAYEIIDTIMRLSFRLSTDCNGSTALKENFMLVRGAVSDTAKSSLYELYVDTRNQVVALQVLPPDGPTIPTTIKVMTRLQTMVEFLDPLKTVMVSVGDGNWKTPAAGRDAPADVGADGRMLLSHYASDTIETLLTNLEGKGRLLLKRPALVAVFLCNNVFTVERMVRTSELGPIMASAGGVAAIEAWKKKSVKAYLDTWREVAGFLLDTINTSRTRPSSSGAVNSADVVKGMSSKDKDAIKEKFKNFNLSFDELAQRHKAYAMERDVRSLLGREVQSMIEPLYARFWDRYHEIDKGKGKYVKWDKSGLAGVMQTLNPA
jgi:exocyst complex component 7